MKDCFGNYPSLCICFISILLSVSCNVVHKGQQLDKPSTSVNGDSFWKLEVMVLPVNNSTSIPINQLNMVMQPYRIKKLTNDGISPSLVLSFRTNNVEQLLLLKDQLLSLSNVVGLNVIKE